MIFNKAWSAIKNPKIAFRIIFLLIIIFLVFYGIKQNNDFKKYSELVLIVVTAVYVFLTYELLLSAREARVLPYINLEFILVDKFDSKFLDRYSSRIKKSEKFDTLQKEYISNPDTFNKNIIFVKVENIGQTNAIDLDANVIYDKKNLGKEITGASQKTEFGTLKKGYFALDIVEVYDNPTSNDYFRIKKCESTLTDVNSKCMKEAPRSQNFSKTISAEYFNMSSNRISFFS